MSEMDGVKRPDPARLELVDAPVRYHAPHLCPYGGGEVYEYREYPGNPPVRMLRCYDCKTEVEEADTLTEWQMAECDTRIGADVLEMIGKGQLRDTPVWDLYQRLLAEFSDA